MSSMSGDNLDRPDDLVLIMLYKERASFGTGKADWKNSNYGMYRGNLYDALQEINIEYFQFDERLEDYSEFMDTLEMFDNLEMFGRFKKGSRISLTEKGEKVAKKLESALNQKQDNAIVTAIAEQ